MVYIVDWDIPAPQRKVKGVDVTLKNKELANRKRMFYYYLNKIKASREISGSMSSKSVMITDDEGLAREVYDLAIKYGRASLYEGSLLASNNHKAPNPAS